MTPEFSFGRAVFAFIGEGSFDSVAITTLVGFVTFCLLIVVIQGLAHIAYEFPHRVARVRWLFDPGPRAHLEYALGDPLEGLRQLDRERSNLEWAQVHRLNTRVALMTASGLYREALKERPSRRLRARLKKAFPSARGLLLLNKAEALYNLGRWEQAERLMLAVAASGSMVSLWMQVGATCQLAWILVHTGRATEAHLLLQGAAPETMIRPYRAEVYFTRALISLELGELEHAERALDDARKVIVRESSRRNLCFLEARLHEARGNLEAAYSSYEAASNMRFKGQGGPELRRWACVATRLGRPEDAAAIERLARERDPQSPAGGELADAEARTAQAPAH